MVWFKFVVRLSGQMSQGRPATSLTLSLLSAQNFPLVATAKSFFSAHFVKKASTYLQDSKSLFEAVETCFQPLLDLFGVCTTARACLQHPAVKTLDQYCSTSVSLDHHAIHSSHQDGLCSIIDHDQLFLSINFDDHHLFASITFGR